MTGYAFVTMFCVKEKLSNNISIKHEKPSSGHFDKLTLNAQLINK